MKNLAHIDIEINHRCNLACRHCSARVIKGTNPDELSVSEIKQVIGDAKKHGLKKLGLTGGEPLYDVLRLKEVAGYCVKSLHLPLHTHTNGTLIRQEMCESGGILSLFESISVTFLGTQSQTHDEMTKTPGSFNSALDGVQKLVKNGLPVTCYFIPIHNYCRGLRDFVQNLHSIGVRRIRIMAMAPSGRARPIYHETLLSSGEIKEFRTILEDLQKEIMVQIEAGYCTRLSLPSCGVLAGHENCMSGENRVHINSRGDVFPCTAASGLEELCLGNIKDYNFDLEQMWDNAPLLKLIRAVHRGELKACSECSQSLKCQFGCIVNACGTMSDRARESCPIANFTKKTYKS